MTKAIFGVHVAGQTQLSLKTKPNATIGSADPVLTISSRIGNPMRVTGRGEWRAALAAGDYIVQLDGQIEHGIDIDVSPAAVFISLAGPTSTNLTSWTGTRVTTVEERTPGRHRSSPGRTGRSRYRRSRERRPRRGSTPCSHRSPTRSGAAPSISRRSTRW